MGRPPSYRTAPRVAYAAAILAIGVTAYLAPCVGFASPTAANLAGTNACRITCLDT